MTFTVLPVPAMGAEDVVVAADDTVFTGTEDGTIWRVDAGTGNVTRLADTGGRPLGLELFDNGDLLVCDAERGLLRVAAGTGEVEVLCDRVDGSPMRFCNNAAIAADGTIWFSDSSAHFGVAKWKDDFVQDTRTGRLMRRDPSGSVTVVLDGLAFANGVALAADESYVCVAETRARTVVRHWLKGPKAGERDLLVGDLPGYPDNISRGSDGLIWVTVGEPGRRPGRTPGTGSAGPAQAGDQDPRGAPAQAQADHSRAGLRRRRARWCRTSTSTTPAITWSPGSGSTTGRVWMGSLHEPAVAVYDPA